MYKLDIIKSRRPEIPSVPPGFTRWKEKNRLYHLISRHCNRPAYFWFNYPWSIPAEGERVLLNSPEAVDQGWFYDILAAIARGEVDPQLWCDTYQVLVKDEVVGP